ncbi:YggT family protein [Anaerotardibacter muris]|uniref:YggT family protein n=1 Tax=Anaerotardibacter muris TaxID=2941505 RepID=UPI0030842B43
MSWQSIIVSLSDAYSLVIVIYVLLSWFPMGGIIQQVRDALGVICEPYLKLFKRIIPPIGGMVDITPIIALLVLQFGVRFIVSLF